jgi:ABC-type nitrate/sulfonate/bicarbonate transport system permease component
MGILVVSLYVCGYASSVRLPDERTWYSFRGEVVKVAIFQALLFCLFTQVHSQIGWIPFFVENPTPNVMYSAIIALGIVFLLVERLLGSDFYRSADAYALLLRDDLGVPKWTSPLVAVLFFTAFFTVWGLASEHVNSTTMSAPFDVLAAFVRLLFGAEATVTPIWGDLFVSSLEICVGVVISIAISLVLTPLRTYESVFVRSWLALISISPVIGMMLPMLLPLVGINRLERFSCSTMLSIGCLTLCPSLKGLWALRDYQYLTRILMAVKTALPLAFVGMLFGELYGAVAGLGFRMISERASANNTTAMAVSLVVVCFFASALSIFGWAAKRTRLRDAGGLK